MGVLFNIEINEKPYFLARGKIKHKDIEQIDLAQILSNIIMAEKTIREVYRKYVLENLKLLGQEKASLIEHLTDLIINVVVLRMHLEKKVFNQNIAESINSNIGFEMKIYLKNYEFMVNGFYSKKLFEKLPSFHFWEEMHFWPLYDKLLYTIRMVVEDGKITHEEGRLVTNLLDEMLHLLIIIFYKLDAEFVLN